MNALLLWWCGPTRGSVQPRVSRETWPWPGPSVREFLLEVVIPRRSLTPSPDAPGNHNRKFQCSEALILLNGLCKSAAECKLLCMTSCRTLLSRRALYIPRRRAVNKVPPSGVVQEGGASGSGGPQGAVAPGGSPRAAAAGSPSPGSKAAAKRRLSRSASRPGTRRRERAAAAAQVKAEETSGAAGSVQPRQQVKAEPAETRQTVLQRRFESTVHRYRLCPQRRPSEKPWRTHRTSTT